MAAGARTADARAAPVGQAAAGGGPAALGEAGLAAGRSLSHSDTAWYIFIMDNHY